MNYRLDKLFELQMGKTPARANMEYWNGNNKWVSISDLSSYDKYVTDTKEYISDLGVSESGIKTVPRNTVVMSFKLSIGKTAITTEDVYTNEAIMAFIDKGVCGINVDYLYYLFSGMDWNKGTNKAVLGLTLNKEKKKKKEIDIPDLHAQNEVVIKLDSLSNLIQLQKQSLDKLDELIKSRFVEMFGDPEINPRSINIYPWKEIFYTQTGKLDSNEAVINGKYPFFTCSKEPLTINEYAYDCEALLLAGNNAAGIYDVKHYNGKFNAYQRTYILQLQNKEWEYAVFKHQLEDKLLFLQSQSKGTNTRYLTMGILNQLSFLVPPIKLQNQFADFVNKVEKQKATVQKSIDKLETLKKSLMQKYFG